MMKKKKRNRAGTVNHMESNGAAGREEILQPLTRRECEVLELFADGLAYRNIADRLAITVNTVSNHLRNIRAKLGANSSIEAVNKARIWQPGG